MGHHYERPSNASPAVPGADVACGMPRVLFRVLGSSIFHERLRVRRLAHDRHNHPPYFWRSFMRALLALLITLVPVMIISLGAVYMTIKGVDGWGWFLSAATLVMSTIRVKLGE